MIRSELVNRLAEDNPHLSHDMVRRMIDTIFSEVAEALAEGRRAEFRGFGVFEVRQYGPRTARNPRTGETVEKDVSASVRFRTGKDLHLKLNPGLSERG